MWNVRVPNWTAGKRIGMHFCLAGILCALIVASSLAAQTWAPTQTIQFIVGFGAGSDTDRAARTISQISGDRSLFSSIVLNKAGANSAIAWSYLKQRVGRGEFVAISAPPLITNIMLGESELSYREFTPLAKLYDVFICFAVKADSPMKSIEEIVKLTATTGKTTWALTGGSGSIPRIAHVVISPGAVAQVLPIRDDQAAFTSRHVLVVLEAVNRHIAEAAQRLAVEASAVGLRRVLDQQHVMLLADLHDTFHVATCAAHMDEQHRLRPRVEPLVARRVRNGRAAGLPGPGG